MATLATRVAVSLPLMCERDGEPAEDGFVAIRREVDADGADRLIV